MAGMRKRVAESLLTLLLLTSAAPATCFGWEPLPADRLACCKQAHHANCSDQLSADACCAGQEQSNQPAPQLASPSATLIAPTTAIVVLFFNTDSLEPVALALRELRARSLHSPPNLFGLPLRI